MSLRFIFTLLARGLAVSILLYGLGQVFGVFLAIAGGMGLFLAWSTFTAFAAFLVFWLVVLLSREPEPIAEWRVLLAEREGRKEQAYQGIRTVLATRRFPVTVSDEGGRLVLRERSYVAYISVFTFGSSLYLGWMMWRSRKGYQLIGQFLADMWHSIKGQNQIEHQILRSERARAVREAVHLACREGLMVALSEDQEHHDTVRKDQQTAPGLPGQAHPGSDAFGNSAGRKPTMPTMPPEQPSDPGDATPGWDR